MIIELQGRISDWMVSPVATLQEDATLAHALHQLEAVGVAALPVLDASARLTGLLGWSDLLRAGRFISRSAERERHLRLPDERVGDIMKTRVPVIRPKLSLGTCARRMLKQQVHRIYVAEDGPLEGVVTTREMRGAVAKARIETPLGELARRSIDLIAAQDPLASAMARLRVNPSVTLVVTDRGAPVGVFSRGDAITAREADPTETLSLWMDSNVLALPVSLSASEAALQVYEQKRRYIIAQDGQTIVGLISGLDFAELVSAHSP